MDTQLSSVAINELATALSKAQGEICAASKTSLNPHFKSKYADLSSIWDACRDPLSKNGLSVLQTMATDDGQLFLVTTLAHSSGQWIRSYAPVISQRQDSQGIGSALTYMRRYSLSAIVGVAPDDDDGEASQGRNNVKSAPAVQPKKVISKEQSIELIDILSECDVEYQQSVMNFIKRDPVNADAISELPVHFYDRVKSAAIKRKEDNRLKMNALNQEKIAVGE